MAITKFGTSNIFAAQKFSRASMASNSIALTGPFALNYLILGGGAGGNRGLSNSNYGSGGAAGIVLEGTTSVSFNVGYAIAIGGGGSGGTTNGGGGTVGGSSSFIGGLISLTATGGNPPNFGSKTGGSNANFSGGTAGGTWPGGGGAGSGAGGNERNGGAGAVSTIDFTQRGGGGGGGGFSSGGNNAGSGGGGGGGAGAELFGSSGATNTGSGGGGADNGAGNGGSGLVIMKFADTRTITITGGLTSSTTTANGFKTVTFTAGTGTVTFS
jgi:hypothetical protein